MAERIVPYLTIKKVNNNGGEEEITQILVTEGNVAYFFPKNTGITDVTYNIYYDDGNGCTAKTSVVVEAGEECQQVIPPDPGGGGGEEPEKCEVYVKCNTSAPKGVKFYITNESGSIVYAESEVLEHAPKDSYFTIEIDPQYVTANLYMYVDFPGWKTDYDLGTKKRVECDKQYLVTASKTVYAIGVVEQIEGKNRVGRFEIHNTFDDDYSPHQLDPADLFEPPRGNINVSFSAYKYNPNIGATNTTYRTITFGTEDSINTDILITADCDQGCWVSYNDATCGSAKGGGTQFVNAGQNFVIYPDTVRQKVQQGKKLVDTYNNITYLLRVQCPF
jgi:hypothetical protein